MPRVRLLSNGGIEWRKGAVGKIVCARIVGSLALVTQYELQNAGAEFVERFKYYYKPTDESVFTSCEYELLEEGE